MTTHQQFAGAVEARMDVASRPRRPLKVGINLPTVEGTLAGKTASWADLAAMASLASSVN